MHFKIMRSKRYLTFPMIPTILRLFHKPKTVVSIWGSIIGKDYVEYTNNVAHHYRYKQLLPVASPKLRRYMKKMARESIIRARIISDQGNAAIRGAMRDRWLNGRE